MVGQLGCMICFGGPWKGFLKQRKIAIDGGFSNPLRQGEINGKVTGVNVFKIEMRCTTMPAKDGNKK